MPKAFTRIAKQIAISVKEGGPDPETNPRLRAAIQNAKAPNMPKENVERAIKKGSGQLDGGANYETITYEGFGPYQVPVIVECLTDNKNRTAPNMRVLFRKGQLGAGGSVSWDFDRVGSIEATPPAGGVDPEEAAIEAGAQDVEAGDEDQSVFTTEPGDLDVVQKALAAAGWTIISADLIWSAKNPVKLDDEKRAEVVAFLEAIDDDDDVQRLFVGLA